MLGLTKSVGLTVLVVAQAGLVRAAADPAAEGERLLSQRSYGDAGRMFAEAARMDAGHPELWFKAGSAWRRAGDCRAAVGAYRKYLEARPDEPEPLYGLGFCLRDVGDLDAAVVALRRYVEEEQAASAAQYRERARTALGDLLFVLGRPREAIPLFETAVREQPAAADHWYSLAYALRSGGRSADAIAAYRRFLELKPDGVDAYYGLGRAYADLGRQDEAREMLIRYLETAGRTGERPWYEKARALLLGMQPHPAATTTARPPQAAPAPDRSSARALVFKPAPPPIQR